MTYPVIFMTWGTLVIEYPS